MVLSYCSVYRTMCGFGGSAGEREAGRASVRRRPHLPNDVLILIFGMLY